VDRSNKGKLGVAALLVVVSLAGCGGSTGSPSAKPSDLPSARPTDSAGPTPTASPTPAPTPTPTLRPTGTFVATGNMTHPRTEATAILLADGKVLIAGGVDAVGIPVFVYVASAELYDPATHKFTRTGSMTTTRGGATATLLSDGRVLIVGGDGCRNPSRCTYTNWAGESPRKSAEVYDPKTGKFTPTGSMAGPRVHATAILMPDGRVLVLSSDNRLVERYDPATGRFTLAGSLLNQYSGVVMATLLPDSKVLVMGDRWPDLSVQSYLGAELFDPASGQSSSVTIPYPENRPNDNQVETATLLGDGRVLVQVFNWASQVNYLLIFDSATAMLTQAGTFDGPHGWLPTATALLPDGRVLFAGGGNFASPDDSAGLYDPSSGFHLLSTKMTRARGDHTMTALPDGTVLLAGGILYGDETPTSAELFVP
jgi:hypothetical protein